jgi:iron complex transport system substrate-binding protein
VLLRLALSAFFAHVCTGFALAEPPARPQRIVSTNLCIDQLLLQLVEPERIVSLSYLSFETGAGAAVGGDMRPNRGGAEEIVALKPDLVFAGSFSTLTTTPLLKRVGIDVVLIEAETSFDDMRASLRRLGAAVGETDRAEAVIAKFDADLAALQARIPAGEMPIYAQVSTNNWIAGDDTLDATISNAGGFRTLGQALGYSGFRSIPLEALIQTKPDVLSTATPYSNPPAMATQALTHPLLRRMARTIPRLDIPSRYTECATPASLEAVRMLVEMRETLAEKAGS